MDNIPPEVKMESKTTSTGVGLIIPISHLPPVQTPLTLQLAELPAHIALAPPTPSAATCARCGKTFTTVGEQWEHIMSNMCATVTSSATAPQAYHCPKFLCSFVSEHTAEIKSHIATVHDKQAKFLLSCLDY